MKKLKNGKRYILKKYSDWLVSDGIRKFVESFREGDEFIYKNDKLLTLNGDLYIADANKYIDDFSPIINESDYNRLISLFDDSFKRAMQGLISNIDAPGLNPSLSEMIVNKSFDIADLMFNKLRDSMYYEIVNDKD